MVLAQKLMVADGIILVRHVYIQAESRALAILEYSANVNIEFIPRNLSITTFEIDEEVIKSFPIKKMPGNWQETPAPFSTKDFGTKLLKKGIPILKLPSTIIPEENNYIINTAILNQHPNLIKIVAVKDCVYDVRIKNV